MCGIAGFWDLPQPPETCRRILEGMTATLAHRGPDGSGVTISGRCGLGHTRLSIIDLATGQQPMSDAEQSVWLTFNGEIFNHVELRDQLMARGRRFRTTSDTEVIIQLYCEFGLDFIHHLHGDFAFGLWDARRRRLLLARDRMGVRPLFYTRVGSGLAFASEVKALLATPGVHAELDPIALDQIFTTWAPIAPRTIFRNILELPPGHMLIASDSGVDMKRYWRLEFPRAADVAPTNSPAALQDECRALLADATRIRLRADVPVGAYLSGGLDSTIVTALARDLGVKDLRTFSVTFDDAEFDESAFQQRAAQALGTQHTAVACSAALIASTLPDVISHAERPILRTAPAPLYTLSDRVQRDGLKVVLTGEGADEVFAGYDIFKEAKLRRFCGRQPGSRWRPLLLRRLYPYLPKLQKQSPQFLSLFFGSEADSVMDPLYSHLPRFRTTGRAKAFFSADLKAALAGYDALADLRASLPEDFRFWHPLSQAQYLEATHLLPGYILSAQGDRVAMAHGVEGRFPFLDHRVVEFAARIPPELKLRGLREKHILRECMSDITPREIIDRPKQPYRAPDAALMMAGGSTAGQIFDPAAIKSSGMFDPAAVARLVAKSARSASLGFSDSAALIGVATTELWNHQFIGADRSAPPTRAHQAALSQKVNP